MRRLVTTTTLLFVAACLAGCSGSIYIREHTVDAAGMANQIAQQLQADNPGLRIGGVICPEGVEKADGASFQCTAEFNGVQAPFTVTMTLTNASTGEFDYGWKPAKPIIDVDKLVKEIEQEHSQSPNAKVDCGAAPVQVLEAGDVIKCTISEGNKHTVVRVVVEDAEGTIRFERQG
jgi:hypothetical protein